MQFAQAIDPMTKAVTTTEIRLIWNSVRRTGSTLGRLRAVAVSYSRRVSVHIPDHSTEDRPHKHMTHWRQLIGPMPR